MRVIPKMAKIGVSVFVKAEKKGNILYRRTVAF
jgi:hypothetical protein